MIANYLVNENLCLNLVIEYWNQKATQALLPRLNSENKCILIFNKFF